MKKFRNYGFWTALSGALVLFLKTLGEACGFTIEKEIVSNLVMAFAELLVVFGIVVMPKDSGSNTEKKDEEKGENQEEVTNEEKQQSTDDDSTTKE